MSSFNSAITQDPGLHMKLLQLNQRLLNKGEVFLLAKAIADTLPLPKEQCDNIRIYTLQHRAKIDNVIYAFEGYACINRESHEDIYRIIDEIVMWRYSVASGTCVYLFTGDPQTVVDDMTGILRYVNMSDACKVSDMAGSANHMYSMFKDVVKALR